MSNNTTHGGATNPYYNQTSRTILVVYLAMLAIPVAVVMNSLMIIAFCTFKRLRITGMYIILNLAVSNLVATLLTIPIVHDIIKDIIRDEWQSLNRSLWCDIRGASDMTLFAVSALTLAASSLDRCWAVCRPFSYHKQVRSIHAYILIAVIWVISIAISIIPMDFTGRYTQDTRNPAFLQEGMIKYTSFYQYSMYSFSCGLSMSANYLPMYLIVAFFLPVMVVIVSYSFILRVALTTISKMGKTFKSVRRKSVSLRQPLPPEFHPTKKALKSSLRTLALVLLFGLSLMPIMLLSFLIWINRRVVMFISDPQMMVIAHFFKVVLWVAHSVYAINPIVYGLMDRKFRNAYRTLIRCKGSYDEFRKEAQKQFYMDLADHHRRRTQSFHNNSENNRPNFKYKTLPINTLPRLSNGHSTNDYQDPSGTF